MAKIAVVFQTHWDREWYFSLDTFNFRLLKVMQRILDLLDEGGIDAFVLDGQVKVVEDYLLICSEENKKKTLDYIKDQKIIIGPWYVLADEFLVQGESLMRNLERGIKEAQRLGDYQKIGYLPDTFGHISQMPQIFHHFNIKDALIWRGVNLDEPWFIWEAPNGSSVQTLYLKTGYYQPIVDQESAEKLLETWVSQQPKHPADHPMLLTNGGDHLMPSEISIPAQLKILSEKTQHTFTQETYESYLQHYPINGPFKQCVGELRNNENAYILPNVLSTRYPLKYANQVLENRLTMHVEPLIALAHLNNPYPNQNYLEDAWRLLLENHPHDSICGCSIDPVHQEMNTRNRKITDHCQAIENDIAVSLNLTQATRNHTLKPSNIFADDTVFTVYNPTPYERHGYQTVSLFLEQSNPLIDQFQITDHHGNLQYTTVVISKKPDRRFASPLDSMPGFRQGFTYEVLFKVNHLEGFGLRTYRLSSGTLEYLVESTERSIENSRVCLTMTPDNHLEFFDKKTQLTYPNVHQFYSSLDAGDEYNYSQPLHDQISHASLVSIQTFKHALYQKMVCHYEMRLPQGLEKNRQSGLTETVLNTFEVTFITTQGTHHIDTELKYLNAAHDQRTRLKFPLPTVEFHHSDTAFDFVKRTVREEVFEAAKGKEVPPVVDPSLSRMSASNGFNFIHLGLHEYQAHKDSVEITLLRSVGSLSRDDLRSRGGGAGPSFETPDAQLVGEHTYRYRWSVSDEVFAGDVLTFKNPLKVFKGALEHPRYLLEIDNRNIVTSSVRNRDFGLELRVFNPTEEAQTFTLKSERPVASIKAVNGHLETLEIEDLFTLPSKTIRTYHIVWKTPQSIHTDVFVAGGSIGGCLAAKTLAEAGHTVLLSEATRWIGGQLTNQAVPLDEHPFIESFGATASYRAFREAVRAYYQETYQLSSSERLNPGNAWVTRLAFEPSVAHDYFTKLLTNDRLTLNLQSQVVAASYDEHQVAHVILKDLVSGNYQTMVARYFIDGTDTGELLPLTGTAYTIGAEAQSDTGEPHAKAVADSQDMQPITYVAALKWDDKATEAIAKPKHYEYFKALKTPYDDHPILSPYGPDSSTGKARSFNILVPPAPLWSYRRIFDPKTLNRPSELERTLLNWPQNDYFMGNIIDDENASEHLSMAKELTRCLIYYLQTEYPHAEGLGLKAIQIDTASLGTEDGFAMAPYIRESRRIKALKTIVEQDVSAKTNTKLPRVEHSVGVGSYHIDLHITTRSHTFFYDHTWPFEIPLEALIPEKKTNLLPACKNIGTTHLTNGCFRLHPVEWNIGEAVGHLVDYCLKNQLNPHQLIKDKTHILRFQEHLDAAGIERQWPEDKVHVI